MISDQPPPRECDIVIVGGGILGLAVARQVLRARPIARLCVLEAEDRLAAHQTSHSSGVVHAGIYYEPGSLKAKLCVDGARRISAYCEERGIAFERRGKLVVATGEDQLGRLEELERRGMANGVEGLRRVRGDEIAEIEPHAKGFAALHSPTTAVVDFAAVTRAFAREVVDGGGTIHTSTPVLGFAANGASIVLQHPGGKITAGAAICCAGLWSDRLAIAAGAPKSPRIIPFRGSYLRVKPSRSHLVRGSVYPVPDPGLPFLGAHFTRGIDGTVLIGPTALIALARNAYRLRQVRPSDLAETLSWPGTWKMMRKNRRAGIEELRHAFSRRSYVSEASRLIPELARSDVRGGPAGIRAQALGRDGRLVDDFVVHLTERAIHVRNAPSPAATSSMALAEMITRQLEDLT